VCRHAPPEDPYALALNVKEWDHLKPTRLSLAVGEACQPRTAELFIAPAKRGGCQFLRQQGFWGGLVGQGR